MARIALRSRIQKQLERQQEEQRQEMLKKRMEIAKEGARLFAGGRTIESVKKYQQYLLILEMWKKCGRDGLTPDLFDSKKDLYEIVLISGVFWDLSKLYDLSKKSDRIGDLVGVLNKFVAFSKGFPHQPLSAEALRRFLSSGRCIHKDEFKDAYKMISLEKCFITAELLPWLNQNDLDQLRAFRENKLRKSIAGRLSIRVYETLSPGLAKLLRKNPRTLPFAAEFIQTITRRL